MNARRFLAAPDHVFGNRLIARGCARRRRVGFCAAYALEPGRDPCRMHWLAEWEAQASAISLLAETERIGRAGFEEGRAWTSFNEGADRLCSISPSMKHIVPLASAMSSPDDGSPPTRHV